MSEILPGGRVKYFESQQDDEEVVLLTRRHVIALVPELAFAVLGYLFGFFAIFVLPKIMPSLISGFAYNIYVLIVSLIFLFSTISFFSTWVLHYLHIALLTTEHFVEIDQYSLFGRKVSALTLDKIQDVSNNQMGIINTLFNLGTVKIQTAGEAPNFELFYVPKPSKICQAIMETEEEYSSRHGIRTEASSHEFSPAPVEAPKIEYPGDEWKQDQK